MVSSKIKITDDKKLRTLFVKALFKILPFRKNGNSFPDQPATQARMDRRLVLSLSKSRIPRPAQLKYIKKFLSARELWLVRACLAVILVSSVWGGAQFYFSRLEIVPVEGGEYVEALIGQPKYLNPLYSGASDADHDISRLIYSSLYKYDRRGELAGDLAESREISEDGKTYRLTIRDGVRWHVVQSLPRDLNTDDVIFTFNAIKDGVYKSPLRPAFAGVETEKEDDRTMKFTLSEPYAAFLELLTFGIMPADLWYKVPPESFGLTELNLKPIGSGPYRFDTLVRDSAGKIVEYSLVPNKDYYETPPLVNIRYKFYSTAEEGVAAINESQADGIRNLPLELLDAITMPNTMNFHKLRLPQMNAVFFNQNNNPLLAEKSVRQALALAIDKNGMIADVLGGNAYAVDGPILPGSFAYDSGIKKYGYDGREALKLLADAGWLLHEITEEDVASATSFIENNAPADGEEPDEAERKTLAEKETLLRLGKGKWQKRGGSYLTVKLTSVDKNENGRVLAAIGDYWRAIGVKTEIELLPASRIQTEIIKSRNFEALFYGQVVGADPDPYALWHSSQAKEGGSNLAGYSNKDTDRLLEDARMISDRGERAEKYRVFQEILAEELPAIFLYSPFYIYAQNKKIKNFDVSDILSPRDRFANIAEWYIKTGKRLVWRN